MQRSGSPMSPVSPTYGPTSPRAYSPQRAFSPGSDAGPSARGKGRRSGPGRPRSSRASAAGSPPPAGRGRPRGSGSGRGRAGKAGTAGPSRAGSARPPAPRSGRSESAAPNEAESDTELEARGGEESLAPEGSVIPPGYEAQDGQEDEPDPEPEDQLLEEDEFSLQKSIDMERKQVMRLLMDAFTPDQYSRHEAYRRSRLSKGSVRKVVNHTLAQSAPDSVLQVVAGMGKVFVGEITESARQVMRERGDEGAIQPEHLLEANRRWKEKRERPGHYPPGGASGAPGLGKRRRLF